MAVQILLNQVTKPAGVPGQAREDLDLVTPVQIQVVGGPFAKVFWSIADKPIDYVGLAISGAVVTAPDSPSTTVTGNNVAGTVLLQVAVDAGFGLGARPEDRASITFYAGPALGAFGNLPVRNPAFGEKKEHNVPVAGIFPQNPRGWALATDFWHRLLGLALATTNPNVADLAALAALPVASYTSGQLAWVRSLDAIWVWSATPVGVADGITVIPDSAAGQWWRMPSLSQRWAEQTAWFVDTATGNDQNDGTAPLPLRTPAELFRRLSPFGTWRPLHNTTVNLVPFAGTYALPGCRYETDRASLNFITVVGTTVLDQWAAITPRNPAGNVLPLAQSTGTPLTDGDLVRAVTSGATVWAPVATFVADNFHVRMGQLWNAGTFALGPTPEPAVADFFDVPVLAKVTMFGRSEVVGEFPVSLTNLELVNLLPGTRFIGFRVNASKASGFALERCDVAGSYLIDLLVKDCRFQCCAGSNINLDSSTTADAILLAGNVWGSSAAPSTQGFGVGIGGKLRVGGPQATDFNTLSGFAIVSDGGFCDLGNPPSLYGLTGWSFQVSAGAYIEKVAGAVPVAYVGSSGADFVYVGINDLWFPPLPVGGGAVPAAASVLLWTVLDAAPFLGYAQNDVTETRWRKR